jgi:hypothetical protein
MGPISVMKVFVRMVPAKSLNQKENRPSFHFDTGSKMQFDFGQIGGTAKLAAA